MSALDTWSLLEVKRRSWPSVARAGWKLSATSHPNGAQSSFEVA